MSEITQRLIDSLQIMMGWAREVPDEFLDGDPDQRKFLREDLEEAKSAIADARGQP